MKPLTEEYLDQKLEKLTTNLTVIIDKKLEQQTQELKAYTDERVEELAQIVARGFAHQQTQLDRIETKADTRDTRLNALESDMRKVKSAIMMP